MKRSPIFYLWLVFSALGFVARADDADSLRVFYTGHSFHMFVPERLAKMAKAADVKEYALAGQQSLGGSRVEQHWDLPDDKNQAKKALLAGTVDVFTMAPNVKMPDAGIDRFAELALEHNPKIRLLVQESWVPWDYLEKRVTDNAQREMTDLAQLRADQQKWRQQMESQVKAINEKAGREAATIIPAGDAVVRLRELVAEGKVPDVTKQSDLFTDPIGHGKGTILLLTSYCNFACITGRTPIGLKMSETGVSDELNELLQQIAWETVTAYPLSGVKSRQ